MPMLMTSVIGWPSAPRTRPSRTSAAKLEHFFPHADDLGHHVLAVDQDRLAVEIAQGGVQDGALLGGVDLLAGEHRLALGFDLGGLGELDERAEDGGVDALLRVIEQEIVEGDAELLEPRRIVGEIRSRRAREHAVAQARSVSPMPLESPGSP